MTSIRSRLARQTTLAREVVFEGVGLHSGRVERVAVRPAAPDSGLVVGASAGGAAATATALATTAGGLRTVEHLLSALRGCLIDNAVVDAAPGSEMPGLDGSAAVFAERLAAEGGIVEQDAFAWLCRIDRPAVVARGAARVELAPLDSPGERAEWHYELDYRARGVPVQRAALAVDYAAPETARAAYMAEIAPARTFGFLQDAPALQAAGLALGASADNTVVFGDDGTVSGAGAAPRFPGSEGARHKLLDAIGDLALVRGRIVGRVQCFASGHALNAEAAAVLRGIQ